jgi:hypothetical protein
LPCQRFKYPIAIEASAPEEDFLWKEAARGRRGTQSTNATDLGGNHLGLFLLRFLDFFFLTSISFGHINSWLLLSRDYAALPGALQ